MGRTGIRIAVFAFIAAASVGLAACGNSSISETGFNAAADGLGLRGYDAVAYFAVNSAVKGNAQFEYVWNGVKWHFSSEENRKAFQQNPEKYAPQYGGYCAYAVSKNYTADGDPEAWK
ncbi:MAG TPA: YHS domain-containing protein, partial [Blastocatellia bacterium]|nr:YHS domain-containing protein [Blastocatellia bacterium]